MEKGKILLLQGPSSAGKTTLARALQTTLDEYWWALGADDITHMLPASQPTGWWEPAIDERLHASWDAGIRLERWLAAYWGCLVTVANTGSNVIAAGGWLKTEWLIQAAKAFNGIDAVCVGVYCPLEECERREVARGDRATGYARSMYDIVHEHDGYDIKVDTFVMSTQQAADHIKAALRDIESPAFFERIRERSCDKPTAIGNFDE